MAYEQDIQDNHDYDKVLVSCDICSQKWSLLLISAKRSIKKNKGKHVCQSCKAKMLIRPQNKKEYWTEEKRKTHGKLMFGNGNYRKSLLTRRKLIGEDNPMFGKEHSIETKRKMSNSRKGKIGINATAWKGGKLSLVRRIKEWAHLEHKWYYRCYERDYFKCRKCGAKKVGGNKIDIHHIEPMAKLIKRLISSSGLTFLNDDEKYLWLKKQPEIVDKDLNNGITLCRACHNRAHANWGSHYPESKEDHCG
jgi:hypothetical protein